MRAGIEGRGEARVALSEENFLEKLQRKYGVRAMVLLCLYVFVRSVVGSRGKTLWYDELLTRLVVLQGSWKGMMAALWGPMDGQPPLFYGIERWASRLAADPQIALRLPSAMAMVAIVWCVFVYARRKGGAVVGVLCAAFLLLTDLFRVYAIEARPYAMTVACIALGLVAYQRAASRRWLVVLGMSLAMAEALHYLAVLTMVPFGLAELFETFERRKVRWGVWIALACGVAPLLFTGRLLLLNKTFYGPTHHFLGFKFTEIPQMYREFFNTSSAMAAGIAFTAMVGTVAAASWSRKVNVRQGFGGRGEETGAGEAVLLVVMAGLPFLAFIFIKATHSAMTSRYVECAILGVALGFGCLLRGASKKALLVFAAFIVGTLGVSELHFWRFAREDAWRAATLADAKARFFAEGGYPELPIAVLNGRGGTEFLWMAQFGKPADRERMVYLTHDTTVGHDTMDLGISVVQRFVPSLRVQRVSDFALQHPRFLVYTEGQEEGQDWASRLLMQRGWETKIIVQDNQDELYMVSRNGFGKEPQIK